MKITQSFQLLKRNLIANYVGQGWTALMNIAFIPLYIKFLGIESYGLIGLFSVLQACLSLLDMGMTPTLGREMGRYTGGGHSAQSIRDLLRSIEVLAIVIAVLMSASVALGSNWLASSWLMSDSLPIGIVTQAFTLMGLVIALRFIEGVYRSALIGLQQQILFNVVSTVMATLRGAGAVGVLAWVSPTIDAFFLWQGIVSIATLVILGAATYASIPQGERSGRFLLDALRSVWRFAGGMMGITVLSLLLTQVDKILLSKLLSLRDFGYYTLAVTGAGALYILVGPIAQTYYPRFCELHARGDNTALIDSYHKGAQLVTVMGGSAAMVLIVYPETFLNLWMQDMDLVNRVVLLMSILVVGNLLNCLMWIPSQMQLTYGWTRLSIYVKMLAVLLLVPAILFMVPKQGAVAAAWIWVLVNASYCIITVHFMYKRIMREEKWRWYWEDVFIPLLAGGLVVGLLKLAIPTQTTVFAQILSLTAAALASLSASGLAAPLVRHQINSVLKKWYFRLRRLKHEK